MKQGRLLVAVVLVACAAALFVSGQPDAQAATSINVCPTPTHGVPGSSFTWQMKSAGCATGSVIPCTTPASVTWDSPATTDNGFSGTVPLSAAPGLHALRGGCTQCGAACFTTNGSGTFTVDAPPTTTTTTTTLPKTTTTTTTQPRSTTTTTTRPGQTTTTTTTRPGQTTTTTTTLPGDTVPETTTSLPPPTTPEGTPIVLQLDQPATPPGGDDEAIGEGCEPNTPVMLVIEGQQVGTASSDAKGHFASHVNVPNLPVGEYDVFAQCGRLLTTKIDIVLPSTLGPPSGTLVVVFFFLLFGLALVRRQIAGDLRR